MFLKPHAIVYVRRGGLIIAGKHIAPARVSFPADTTANLEVLNQEAFVASCQEFFREHGVKGQRVLLVLDHGVVFTKSGKTDRATKQRALIDSYVAAMPFESGSRLCLAVRADDTITLFATPAPFFSSIVEALDAAGAAKVTAVTPVAAYGLKETDQLSTAVVDQLLRDTTVRANANFLSIDPA